MREFKGKVAVITGAASGIGRGIAERCVSEGMKVVLADIDAANLTKAETELRTSGGTVLGVRTDVSKRSDVELLARRALDAFGQVHLLFNNAGVGAGGAPWEATWNDWEWVIGVNLWGVIHGVKVFTPLMLAQNTECHIVNTSSAAGLVVGGGSAPYAATKHAVVALSESLYLALQQRNSLVKASVGQTAPNGKSAKPCGNDCETHQARRVKGHTFTPRLTVRRHRDVHLHLLAVRPVIARAAGRIIASFPGGASGVAAGRVASNALAASSLALMGGSSTPG